MRRFDRIIKFFIEPLQDEDLCEERVTNLVIILIALTLLGAFIIWAAN